MFASTGQFHGTHLNRLAAPFEFGGNTQKWETYISRQRKTKERITVRRRAQAQIPPRTPKGRFLYPAVASRHRNWCPAGYAPSSPPPPRGAGMAPKPVTIEFVAEVAQYLRAVKKVEVSTDDIADALVAVSKDSKDLEKDLSRAMRDSSRDTDRLVPRGQRTGRRHRGHRRRVQEGRQENEGWLRPAEGRLRGDREGSLRGTDTEPVGGAVQRQHWGRRPGHPRRVGVGPVRCDGWRGGRAGRYRRTRLPADAGERRDRDGCPGQHRRRNPDPDAGDHVVDPHPARRGRDPQPGGTGEPRALDESQSRGGGRPGSTGCRW